MITKLFQKIICFGNQSLPLMRWSNLEAETGHLTWRCGYSSWKYESHEKLQVCQHDQSTRRFLLSCHHRIFNNLCKNHHHLWLEIWYLIWHQVWRLILVLDMISPHGSEEKFSVKELSISPYSLNNHIKLYKPTFLPIDQKLMLFRHATM